MSKCDACKAPTGGLVKRFLNGRPWQGCVPCWAGILRTLDGAR